DVLDASDLLATNASQLIKLTVNGGAGNDTLIGSPGNDSFVWNPGDGSDTIEGGDGEDMMVVNGSDLAETFALSASGTRARLPRATAGLPRALGGVETTPVNARGGPDTATVNALPGTAVTQINLDLAGTVGGTAGDGQADAVIVNGRNADDL